MFSSQYEMSDQRELSVPRFEPIEDINIGPERRTS